MVILFLEEADDLIEDNEFKQAAVSDFFRGYSESDSIYDRSK